MAELLSPAEAAEGGEVERERGRDLSHQSSTNRSILCGSRREVTRTLTALRTTVATEAIQIYLQRMLRSVLRRRPPPLLLSIPPFQLHHLSRASTATTPVAIATRAQREDLFQVCSVVWARCLEEERKSQPKAAPTRLSQSKSKSRPPHSERSSLRSNPPWPPMTT